MEAFSQTMELRDHASTNSVELLSLLFFNTTKYFSETRTNNEIHLNAKLVETTYYVVEIPFMCFIKICTNEGQRVGKTVLDSSLRKCIDVILCNQRHMRVALIFDGGQSTGLTKFVDEPSAKQGNYLLSSESSLVAPLCGYLTVFLCN